MGGEGRGGSRFAPGAALPAGMGWVTACGRPGQGPRLCAPATSPFVFIFPARPPFGQAFPCAPTVRAACSLHAGAAPEPRSRRLGASLPSLSS